MRGFVILLPVFLLGYGTCDSADNPVVSDEQSIHKFSSRSFELTDDEAYELNSVVNTSKIEGLAAVPTSDGENGQSGMDIYSWDAGGKRSLFKITKLDVRGLFKDIFYTPNHLVFVLSENNRKVRSFDKNCSVVILTKATGRLHCFANMRISKRIVEWAHKPVIQTDDQGDRLLFQVYGSGGYEDLVQINMSGDSPDFQYMHQSPTAYHDDYAVNGEGDVIHKVTNTSKGKGRVFMHSAPGMQSRIIGSDGDAEGAHCITTGVQENVQNFYVTGSTQSGGGRTIVKFTKQNDGSFVQTDLVGAIDELRSFSCQFVLKNEDKIYFFGLKDEAGYLFQIKDGPSPEYSATTVPDMVDVIKVVGQEGSLFILGEDKLRSATIYQMNTDSGEFIQLLPHYRYMINDLSASADGKVIFTGERMKDSSYVKGFIDISTKEISPVKIDFPAVRQLVPLN